MKKNKQKGKGFFTEFREFITRGNILELAVGVIIGAAFSTIVTALTNKIIMPLINLIVNAATGGKGINLITILNGEPQFVDIAGVQTLNEKCIYIDWGVFIEAILNFILIALVLFLIVKAANSIAKKKAELDAKMLEEHYKKHPEDRPLPPEEVPPTPTELDVLNEIRDLLKEKKK